MSDFDFILFFKLMVYKKVLDLFIMVGVVLLMKVQGCVVLIMQSLFSLQQLCDMVLNVMMFLQCEEFEKIYECQFVIFVQGVGCFCVLCFYQCNCVGMVLCWIELKILIIEEFMLLLVIKQLVMIKCGIIIFVGGIGIGKLILLVVMIGYCNINLIGYIIIIEDFIEYVYKYEGCIIIQCEIGIDIESWENVLKNILCQVLDVIMIGEVCICEMMEYVINFFEIGYLCLCMLYVNNVNQVMDCILYFFLEDCCQQLFMDLLLNFKGIVVQQLIFILDGKVCWVVVEVLLGMFLVQDYICQGEIYKFKEVMKEFINLGMKIFDQSLVEFYYVGEISYEDVLCYVDSLNEVCLCIKLVQGGDVYILLQGFDGVELEELCEKNQFGGGLLYC